MQSERRQRTRLLASVVVLILSSVVFTSTALARKTPKTYPEEGKITATALNEVPYTSYVNTGGPNGGATTPVHGVRLSRTYTVQTDTKTYEFDCGKHPGMFSKTPGECGGDKKLQLGDAIHFRIQKGFAYIPVPETVEPSGEQKLRILNEELRSDAEPAGKTPATEPEKADPKPPEEKK